MMLTENTVETFQGARLGERLLVAEDGVTLLSDGEPLWHAAREDIHAVDCTRQVRGWFVDDIVHVGAHGGDEHRFLVASSDMDDDYDCEFAEAVADAIAESIRRAAGLG